MILTIEDLKRAISSGGEVSTFARLYQSALAASAPEIAPRVDLELPLPALDVFLSPKNMDLAGTVSGQGPSNLRSKAPCDIDLKIITAPSAGKNLGIFLKEVIEQVQPDFLALNLDPVALTADARYAFSLPSAVGFSFTAEIRDTQGPGLYAKRSFRPHSLSTQAILLGRSKGIPVLPLGKRQAPAQLTYIPGQGYVDLNFLETARFESQVHSAEDELDILLVRAGEKSNEAAGRISKELMTAASSSQREQLIEESCYFISRLMDILLFQKTRELNPRLLIISDLAHFQDISYLGGLLLDGVTDEIYVDAKSMPETRSMVIDGVSQPYLENDDLPFGGASPLFLARFDGLINCRLNEELSQEEGLRLAVKIAERTRRHPDIARGLSVRGAIAMIEVLRGFVLLRGLMTRESVERAAILTCAPRLVMKAGKEADGVLRDILKEVFFDFSFESDSAETALRSIGKLTSGDILEKLNEMGPLPEEGSNLQNAASAPTVIPENEGNRNILKKLEKMNYLKKGQNGQYNLTLKALQTMLDQLEKRLHKGEITAQEYNLQKAALHSRMQNLNQPRFKMSSKELANTIMELIDAQDRQWNKDISFQGLRTYYHIKENSEGAEIGEEKSDYYSLQKLIDDLEKRKILAAASQTSGLLLTGLALDMLLKNLLEDERAVKNPSFLNGRGKTVSFERSYDVRRFSFGDAFRDIALRPTLREMARQRRNLRDIRRSDLRVFLRQPRKPETDIVVCMDTSGSMGFHQKLMYARLVAAGLIQGGLREKNRVGLVAFNDSGQVTIPLTSSDKEQLLNCIAGLNARGNTNIGEGIKSSAKMFFKNPSSNRKQIILISDGQPTALSESAFSKLKDRAEEDLTEESAIMETRSASAKGILLSVIHIAGEGQANDKFVKNIALAGKGKLQRISGPDDLRRLLN